MEGKNVWSFDAKIVLRFSLNKIEYDKIFIKRILIKPIFTILLHKEIHLDQVYFFYPQFCLLVFL